MNKYVSKIGKEVKSCKMANFSFPENACLFWGLCEPGGVPSGDTTSPPISLSQYNTSCSNIFQIQRKRLSWLFSSASQIMFLFHLDKGMRNSVQGEKVLEGYYDCSSTIVHFCTC